MGRDAVDLDDILGELNRNGLIATAAADGGDCEVIGLGLADTHAEAEPAVR